MGRNVTSILDFGSSRITLLVGTEEVNKSFRLLSSIDYDYEGFAKGEFVDPNNLQTVIAEILKKAERELEFKIDNIFVGVPAEFCFVYDAMLTKTFAKKTKITNKIVDNLFLEDNSENPYQTHTVINKAPLFYIVNDDNRTNDPVGIVCNKLQARTSYVLVENKFELLISGILKSLGIKEFDFLSSTLAEGLYLIDEHKRNEGAILVDCGYSTTSVSLVLGAGLKELKSFSLGGGHITADLSKHLGLEFEEAEDVKKDIILTLNPNGADCYTSESGKKFAIKSVNEIALARIDRICELIRKCIDGFEMQLPEYLPLYFTGGGLNYLEGITDYLRKAFNRPIELVAPRALLYRKPDLSSAISLLNITINLYK